MQETTPRAMLQVPMTLRFSKYEGLGNDFLVLDDAGGGRTLDSSDAVALCDRHLGVGGDGLLLVSRRGERPAMKVINADGSVPEMCGNGIRCVALHLVRTGVISGREVAIDTDAGPHLCLVDATGDEGLVEVTMRTPSLVPNEIPLRGTTPLVDATIDVAGRSLRGTAVSMGNPHFVTFDDVGEERLSIGPRVGRDPRFPEGVNVGFARISAPDAITLDVFERGAGWTRACGTGACAAAVAAVETHRAARGAPISVRLPGGVLTIVVGEPGEPVRMRGPARHVFDGQIPRPA